MIINKSKYLKYIIRIINSDIEANVIKLVVEFCLIDSSRSIVASDYSNLSPLSTLVWRRYIRLFV
jgi:hypothetical protein